MHRFHAVNQICLRVAQRFQRCDKGPSNSSGFSRRGIRTTAAVPFRAQAPLIPTLALPTSIGDSTSLTTALLTKYYEKRTAGISAQLGDFPIMNAAAQAPTDLQEAIRRRAEEIYIRNGKIPGHDLENWAQAEHEIMREFTEPAPRRTAIVVKVNGAAYVGEYDPASSDYQPGEFAPGVSVPVRLRGNKMQLLRPNGKVLETTIVKRIS